ncbi:MAG TPA: hypothetical protein PL066_02895 [bacterium]|mgnify:CR=1 FL=1|nr:hypothetical protein [bacterium]
MSISFVNFDWLGNNGKLVVQKKSTELLSDFVDFLGLGERDLIITFHSEFSGNEMPVGQRFQVATTEQQCVYLKMKAGSNIPVLQVLFPQPANISFSPEMDWGKYVFLGVRLFNVLTKVFNYKTGLVKFRRLYKIFSGAQLSGGFVGRAHHRFGGPQERGQRANALVHEDGEKFLWKSPKPGGECHFLLVRGLSYLHEILWPVSRGLCHFAGHFGGRGCVQW